MYVALEATGRLLKIDAASYATLASLDVGPNPRQLSVTRRRQPRLRLAVHHAAAAGRKHGGRADARRAAAKSSSSTGPRCPSRTPSCCGTATSPISRTRAAASRTTSARSRSRRTAARPGCPPSRTTSSAACCATTLEPHVPEHGPRDQLAHRPAGGRRGLRRSASTTTTPALRARRCTTGTASTCSSRSRRAARSRSSMPMAAGKSSASPSAARRRALRSRRTAGRLYVSNFMDRTRQRVRPLDAARRGHRGRAARRHLDLVHRGHGKAVAAGAARASSSSTTRRTRASRATATSAAPPATTTAASDGRVWDLTGFGEGLRNTVNLRGRAGGQGFLHWSNNFDEVQDFEGQIRNLSGGSGLMTNAQFNAGTRSTAARRPEGRPQRGSRCARRLRRVAECLRAEPAPERRRQR